MLLLLATPAGAGLLEEELGVQRRIHRLKIQAEIEKLTKRAPSILDDSVGSWKTGARPGSPPQSNGSLDGISTKTAITVAAGVRVNGTTVPAGMPSEPVLDLPGLNGDADHDVSEHALPNMGDRYGPQQRPYMLLPRSLDHRSIPKPRDIPINELVIKGEVGRGAFGTVYLADWRGAEVAVKRLHVQELDSDSMAEFVREAGLMELLGNHPSVIRSCGVCTTPPNVSIVTQYLPHGSVASFLQRERAQQRSVDFRLLLRMAKDAASGVLHLHMEGVVHRYVGGSRTCTDTIAALLNILQCREHAVDAFASKVVLMILHFV